MKVRGSWKGMMNIGRFNWPFYAAALIVSVAACGALLLSAEPFWWRAGAVVLAGAGYFVFGSLGVSHLIYDRSDRYRWRWLDRALQGARQDRAVFCHAGFDDTSPDLRRRLSETIWIALDHFDETRMTEASIRRARRSYPPTPGTLACAFDRWPVVAHSVDLVFALLAIHELRSERERSAWFAEARRCLRPGGRIILVEHVRDFANFLAFGPGFFHFHSAASWQRAWEAGGCRLVGGFRVTPWVRVFLLEAS